MAGPTVLNRFELGDRLGSGGYGTVYRALDLRLDREVAVKVIDTAPGSGARVTREARAAARLSHPSIVALYEFVHHEYGPEGGRAFLVSELVDGDTVRSLIDRNTLSDREIAGIGADLCDALAHAHERGVIHRDIKPGNLILPVDGTGVKLMDFGIARIEEAEDLTATGDILGTLAYMPPEQAHGQLTGPPGDVFSLALTLYEAWTGENPRRGRPPAVVLASLERTPPHLERIRPDLPPGLGDLIEACLDPDPAGRPATGEIARELRRLAPQLDPVPPVAPEPEGTAGLRTMPAADLLAGLTVGAGVAAALGLAGEADSITIGIAFITVALLTMVATRLGMLLGVLGTAAWLGLVAGQPGAGLLLAVVTLPAVLTVRGETRSLAAIAAAPLLGTLGLAPAAVMIAATATRWRDRATVAATAITLTVLIAAAGRTDLLPGTVNPASGDWADSITGTIIDLVVPAVSSPAFLLGLPGWVVTSVLLGSLFGRYRRKSTAAGVGSGPGAGHRETLEHELLP